MINKNFIILKIKLTLKMKAFLLKSHESKIIIKQFLLISILSCFINSTLIGEKIPLSNFVHEFKGELKSIENAPWSFNKIDYKSYDYENPGLGKINFSNFNLYYSYFNIDKLQIRIDNDNNYILEDIKEGTFTNILSFEYQTSQKQNKGLFKFDTTSMKVLKKFYNENNLINQSVKFELNWKIVSIDLTEESLRDLIESGLSDFLNNVASILIKQSIEKDVNDFYDKLNKKNSELNNMLVINGTIPNIEYRINLAYDKVPQLASPLTNFTIFSLSGVVNNITHNITDLPKFIFDNDTLVEFTISRIMLKDIIGLMTDNGLFDYSINQYNLYNESLFDLNIDYLANIIPEIANVYPRTQEIIVYNVVREITYQENIKDKFIFVAAVETQIKEKTEDNIIFKFNHNLTIELKPIINNTNLNFYFDGFTFEGIKIISDSYSFVNILILEEYLKSYYNIYLNKNQTISLFANSIDLSRFCSGVIKNAFNQYGFNMLFDSKVKYYLKDEIREKALKFLGEKY